MTRQQTERKRVLSHRIRKIENEALNSLYSDIQLAGLNMKYKNPNDRNSY